VFFKKPKMVSRVLGKKQKLLLKNLMDEGS
jgi:hypothetical protein